MEFLPLQEGGICANSHVSSFLRNHIIAALSFTLGGRKVSIIYQILNYPSDCAKKWVCFGIGVSKLKGTLCL